jgi:chromosomal replication initiator protein
VLLDGRFRFDNFVVGAANRLAVAAARAVAESPGSIYNPLVIYSGSGLGKTHLIGALGYAAKSVQPDLTVEYISLDDFVDQLHLAISSGQADAFKQRYQEVGLLLLDDVQFLTGRRETQSEMLRIFNALQGSGRQIVMASDRPPSDIADVDERLLTRLSGGLIVDIGVPEYETKVAILRNKCAERALAFETGVLEQLARMPFSNVRELQGALNRLVAHQSIIDAPLSAADVYSVVNGARTPAPHPAIQPTPPAPVSAIVSDEFTSFLSDVAVAVAQSVDSWRVRLGARIVHWSDAGYRTTLLDRAMEAPNAPDIEVLDATIAAAVARLEALEAEAVLLDPALAGHPAFRDPDRVVDAEARLALAIAAHDPPPAPLEEHTRTGFVAGGSNQMAVRAADAVVAEPGVRYNPLFVHGPSGVGKTHLVHAVGNALVERGVHGPVACVSGAQFVDELIAAIQDGTVERWRARYRTAAALIIDDVHLLAGKERSQDELFHLFNVLHEDGCQVVLSSDRAPGEIPDLEPRLRSRFDGGLVVAMQTPDRGIREALFARALADFAPNAEPGLAPLLADAPVTTAFEIRALVGRLVDAAQATGEPVGRRHVRRELGTADRVTPADVGAPAMDPFFLDPEKVLFEWNEVDGRIIEELR